MILYTVTLLVLSSEGEASSSTIMLWRSLLVLTLVSCKISYTCSGSSVSFIVCFLKAGSIFIEWIMLLGSVSCYASSRVGW